MDEKQKESAMNFFEKHQKDFPQYCDQGYVSVHTVIPIGHLTGLKSKPLILPSFFPLEMLKLLKILS